MKLQVIEDCTNVLDVTLKALKERECKSTIWKLIGLNVLPVIVLVLSLVISLVSLGGIGMRLNWESPGILAGLMGSSVILILSFLIFIVLAIIIPNTIFNSLIIYSREKRTIRASEVFKLMFKNLGRFVGNEILHVAIPTVIIITAGSLIGLLPFIDNNFVTLITLVITYGLNFRLYAKLMGADYNELVNIHYKDWLIFSLIGIIITILGLEIFNVVVVIIANLHAVLVIDGGLIKNKEFNIEISKEIDTAVPNVEIEKPSTEK